LDGYAISQILASTAAQPQRKTGTEKEDLADEKN